MENIQKSTEDGGSSSPSFSSSNGIVTNTAQQNTTDQTNSTEQNNAVVDDTSVSQGTEIVGEETTSGGIVLNPSNKPSLFLNFRTKSEPTANLLFRFRTDDISGSAGDSSGSWVSDSSIKNLTLSAPSGNPLKVVSAYGKKFYELGDNSYSSDYYIQNDAVNLNFSSLPNYTILVFAIGNETVDFSQNSSGNLNTLLSKFSSIHQFGKGLSNNVYNLGKYIVNNNVNRPIFSFAGSLMNRDDIVSNDVLYWQYGMQIKSSNIFDDLNSEANNFGRTYYSSTKRNTLSYFNSYDFGTDLTAPETKTNFVINDGSSVNLQTFCLFFVEIFTYSEGTNSLSGNPIIKIQNRINGVETLNSSYTTKQNITA